MSFFFFCFHTLLLEACCLILSSSKFGCCIFNVFIFKTFTISKASYFTSCNKYLLAPSFSFVGKIKGQYFCVFLKIFFEKERSWTTLVMDVIPIIIKGNYSPPPYLLTFNQRGIQSLPLNHGHHCNCRKGPSPFFFRSTKTTLLFTNAEIS